MRYVTVATTALSIFAWTSGALSSGDAQPAITHGPFVGHLTSTSCHGLGQVFETGCL